MNEPSTPDGEGVTDAPLDNPPLTDEQLQRRLSELEAEKTQAEISKLNRESRWHRPANVVAFLTAFGAFVGLGMQYKFSTIQYERDLLRVTKELERTKAERDATQLAMQSFISNMYERIGVVIRPGKSVEMGEVLAISGTVSKRGEGKPFPGVQLVAISTEAATNEVLGETLTDESGKYVLKFIREGEFTLRVSKQGAMGPGEIPLVGDTNYTIDVRLFQWTDVNSVAEPQENIPPTEILNVPRIGPQKKPQPAVDR